MTSEPATEGERDPLALAEELAGAPETVTLPGGRTLGYATCGDPDGDPLLVCHGFPNSRVLAALFDAPARDHGLRVLCPDRPGMGVSDPAPDRTLADWAADAEGLLDGLGVDSVRVYGVSAGGPYALAAAATLGERVERVAVAAGDAPMESVGLRDRLPYYLARYTPRLHRLAMWAAVRKARNDPESFLGGFADRAGPPDDALWTGTVGRVVHASVLEAVRVHGLKPLTTDVAVRARPWDVDLSAIAVPVGLWYGEADILVPPAMGAYLADAIPTAEFHRYPELDHLSAFTHNEADIFTFLTD